MELVGKDINGKGKSSIEAEGLLNIIISPIILISSINRLLNMNQYE